MGNFNEVSILGVIALWGECRDISTDQRSLQLFVVRMIKSHFFSVKIDIGLIKTFLNLLTFCFINSLNFNAEFSTLMIFCSLHHRKNNAQNDRSDSTPRIVTLVVLTLLRQITADLLNFVINFAEKERAFADIWTVYVKNLTEMPQKSHNECLRISVLQITTVVCIT